MWHVLFLALQWHRGKRGFVILSLAFVALLLYAVAHVHCERNGARAYLRERRLWSTSRAVFDLWWKPEYPCTPRIRFSIRVAVAARGTHLEMARAVFRSTPASVRPLIEPTPTQDHWQALFRPCCSGICLLRR
jgi:hypothetical protein